MKHTITYFVCALALLFCSCEKQEKSYAVAFLMSVEIKSVPADGYYTCVMTTDRATPSEYECAKGTSCEWSVKGGAAIWDDRVYGITILYRSSQDVDTTVLAAFKTPDLLWLRQSQYPECTITYISSEIGDFSLTQHFKYY